MLVGLCGAAGSGKTTIADWLRDRHGYRVMSFADPLYDAVSAITGVPVERLKDRATKEAALPGIGKSPRYLLQTLGTEWGRNMVSKDLWINAALSKVTPGENAVIGDVRFDNEADAILERGGLIVYVYRSGWQCLSDDTAAHPSEAGVSFEKIDAFVDNSSSVDQLLARVSQLIIEESE